MGRAVSAVLRVEERHELSVRVPYDYSYFVGVARGNKFDDALFVACDLCHERAARADVAQVILYDVADVQLLAVFVGNAHG